MQCIAELQQQKPAATARHSYISVFERPLNAMRCGPPQNVDRYGEKSFGQVQQLAATARGFWQMTSPPVLCPPTAATSRDKGQRSWPAGKNGRICMSGQNDHMFCLESASRSCVKPKVVARLGFCMYCTAHHRRPLRSWSVDIQRLPPVLSPLGCLCRCPMQAGIPGGNHEMCQGPLLGTLEFQHVSVGKS